MIKSLDVEVKDCIINMASEIVYLQKNDWCNASVRPLRLSLMRPRSYFPYDTKERYPLIIWICGGGFSGVNHNVWTPELVYFAKHGYAVASIEYSVKCETEFPEPEEEIKSAIRYLRYHEKEYNINTEKIIIAGESAGGYLAAFTGLTNNCKEYDKGEYLEISSAIQGVIIWYPVCLPCLHEGTKITGRPELPKLVRKSAPPFLIFHGTNDDVVSMEESKSLYEALQKEKIQAELYLINGANHGDQHFVQEKIKKIMLDFIEGILK